MKVIIAPDSFKGSLTAKQAAAAIEAGVKAAAPDAECVQVPMADGGEGTVQSLVDATGGRLKTVRVTGPLDSPVEATYGLLGDGTTAVIEMAAASGIQFVNEQTRNPLVTTTYGTGELIEHALDDGVTTIILDIGGSATTDGGAGMAEALGVRLLDAAGDPIAHGGGFLGDLATVDVSGLDARIANTEIRIASDVTNPLTGPTGSAEVFGPQKGTTPGMVKQLDANLGHYAQILKEQLGKDIAEAAGAGAAGGLGAGLLAFTKSQMFPGIDIVVEATRLCERAMGADLCFTGEGGIDFQTKFGKTPMGTAKAVKAASPDAPVVALAGFVGEGIDQLYDIGIDAVFGVVPGAATLAEAINSAEANVRRTAENVMRLVLSTRGHARR
jgi:glycerate kinase